MVDAAKLRRYMLFDTETTALVQNSLLSEAHQPEIIELFALAMDETGEEFGTLHFYCQPRRAVSSEITKLTGITNERLEREKPFAAYFPALVEFMSQCDAIVAHNLAFDMEVLRIEAQRIERTAALHFPRVKICTVEQTEWISGFRMSLSDLHQFFFSEKFEGAHSAESDVRAMKRCFVEMIKLGYV